MRLNLPRAITIACLLLVAGHWGIQKLATAVPPAAIAPQVVAVPNISSFTDPSVKREAHTASDTVNATGGLSRSVYVGTGGDLVEVDADGNTTPWTNVPTGAFLPIRAKRINATGTTASGFVFLYIVLSLEPFRRWLNRKHDGG